MLDLEDQLEGLHPAAFAWAVSCARGDLAEAEEVLQTTYLKVLDGRARFAGRSSLKTWLFAVIRRTASERRRRSRLRSVLLLRWAEPTFAPRKTADPEQETAGRLGSDTVRRALAALSRRQRQVLELVFYQDLTVDDAARVLAISVGSARVHYARGKKNMLAALAPEVGDVR